MRLKRIFTSIDSHTAGNPTRTIIGGLPYVPGKTVSEKMLYLKNEQDWIRQALMFEPRGNEVMSGCVLTEPCDPMADIGVIYIEVDGYLPMCGHDTIGVSTALIESGIIEPKEPITRINLDTPAGLVKVDVSVKDNVAKEVTFTNIPSFCFAKDKGIMVEGFGKVNTDISYGGNFYVIVSAEDFGLDLIPENKNRIIEVGRVIRKSVNEQVDVYHPEKSFIKGVTHVMFTGTPNLEGSDVKNTVVLYPGSIDRSPCGTGCSARLAAFYAKKEIGMNEPIVFESIINTIFKGKIVGEAKVGEFDAIIPQITGQAFITGMNTWIIDPEDPLQNGFML